jgi:hypothetical protein
MHLSREMRRFEMDDLSSRRGDRKRYATQQMMTTIPTQSEIDDFVAACPKNVPHSFVDFHRKHGAVKMDIESIGSGLVWMWPLRDVLRFSHEYGFDEFASGLLGFGTDGCGELYAIDVRENGTGAVGDIPATSLQHLSLNPMTWMQAPNKVWQNKPLHTEPRAARILKSMSIAAAR